MITPCPHCQSHIEIDAETQSALKGHSHFACPVCQGAVPVPPSEDDDDMVIVPCVHCGGEFEVDQPTITGLQGRIVFPCPICSRMLPVSMLPRSAAALAAAPAAPISKRVLVTPPMSPRPATGSLPSPAVHHVPAYAAPHAKVRRKLNRNLLILGSAALLALGGLGFFLASPDSGEHEIVKEKVVNEIVRNKFFQDLIASGVTTEAALDAVAKVEPDGNGYVGFSRAGLTWKEAQDLARRTGSEVVALDDTRERTGRQFAEWLAGVFPSLHGSTVWVMTQGRERISDLPDVLPVSILERRRPALFSWQDRQPPSLVRWRAPDGADFVTIPAGSFQMGDSLDGDGNAPVIEVTVSPFQIQTTEITKSQWDDVREWALEFGYTDLPAGEGRAPRHPVQKINWHDAVKWCNARSEKDGLQPCYQVAGEVYRLGVNNEVECDWKANGYRLPTEAEWEKAARGTWVGRRYPWGYTISHDQANFRNDGKEPYRRGTMGYHPQYRAATPPYTSPVGEFPANDYGLHDMAGNVWEWCWDWYERHQYRKSDGTTDPRGPETIGTHRVLRGGSWYSHAYYTRSAIRVWLKPESPLGNRGFRTVLSGAEPRVARPVVAQPKPAFDIALIEVEAPATLSAEGEVRITAKAGERFTLRVACRYRAPEPTKLAANLLMKDAGILAPDVIAELQQNHATTWHFDTESRQGFESVNGEGTIRFDLTGYAPANAGEHRFPMNFGLFDKATWATKILKLNQVVLEVTE